jgi:hypothetical protein
LPHNSNDNAETIQAKNNDVSFINILKKNILEIPINIYRTTLYNIPARSYLHNLCGWNMKYSLKSSVATSKLSPNSGATFIEEGIFGESVFDELNIVWN